MSRRQRAGLPLLLALAVLGIGCQDKGSTAAPPAATALGASPSDDAGDCVRLRSSHTLRGVLADRGLRVSSQRENGGATLHCFARPVVSFTTNTSLRPDVAAGLCEAQRQVMTRAVAAKTARALASGQGQTLTYVVGGPPLYRAVWCGPDRLDDLALELADAPGERPNVDDAIAIAGELAPGP